MRAEGPGGRVADQVPPRRRHVDDAGRDPDPAEAQASADAQQDRSAPAVPVEQAHREHDADDDRGDEQPPPDGAAR
ncbi:hypothetical protein GCM10009826_14910 [Humibacillus xanthopallidus]